MTELAKTGRLASAQEFVVTPVSLIPASARKVQARLFRHFLDVLTGVLVSGGNSSEYTLSPLATGINYALDLPNQATYNFIPHVSNSAGCTLNVGEYRGLPMQWPDGSATKAGEFGPETAVTVRLDADRMAFTILAPSRPDPNGSQTVLDRINDAVAAGAPITRSDEGSDERVGKADLASLNLPAGTVQWHAGSVPAGWLECKGQLVSRVTYARLFAAIGTTWGAGDGSTTFAVPDMRGRDAVGASGNPGAKGGAEEHTLAVSEIPAHSHVAALDAFTDGGHTHTVTVAEDGAHVHGTSGASTGPALNAETGTKEGLHIHLLPGTVGSGGGTVMEDSFQRISNSQFPSQQQRQTGEGGAHTHELQNMTITSAGGHTHMLDIPNTTGAHTHEGTVTVENAGGGEGHNNMQPWLALVAIIRT